MSGGKAGLKKLENKRDESVEKVKKASKKPRKDNPDHPDEPDDPPGAGVCGPAPDPTPQATPGPEPELDEKAAVEAVGVVATGWTVLEVIELVIIGIGVSVGG